MPTKRFHIPSSVFEAIKAELRMTHQEIADNLGIAEVSSKKMASTGDAPEQAARMLAAFVVMRRHPAVLREYQALLAEFSPAVEEKSRLSSRPTKSTPATPVVSRRRAAQKTK